MGSAMMNCCTVETTKETESRENFVYGFPGWKKYSKRK